MRYFTLFYFTLFFRDSMYIFHYCHLNFDYPHFECQNSYMWSVAAVLFSIGLIIRNIVYSKLLIFPYKLILILSPDSLSVTLAFA